MRPIEGPFFSGASSTPSRWQMLATALANAARSAKLTTTARAYGRLASSLRLARDEGPLDNYAVSPLVADWAPLTQRAMDHVLDRSAIEWRRCPARRESKHGNRLRRSLKEEYDL